MMGASHAHRPEVLMMHTFRQVERALLLLGDAGLCNDNVDAPAHMHCSTVTQALWPPTKLQAGARQQGSPLLPKEPLLLLAAN